ncbi:GTP cyclohydrolase I [Fusarium austroafricanum]|uniref:GTP cyclohydrolase 1 n=1 Tax=Fusarium austroafricanum TaxID=2364996 RepID=A0A8H4NZP8_9HYPO|nr:GTP cyclohydrolase I [Fusarium austroafricanum]
MASSLNSHLLSKKRAHDETAACSQGKDASAQNDHKKPEEYERNILGIDSNMIGNEDLQGESQVEDVLRLGKMQCAVRTLLECIGEDPSRDGLQDTPSRYAKALLFLTKGYRANLEEMVNNALFHEDHNEMVLVKNIDVFSVCEHHLVPFTGKESHHLPTFYDIHIGYIPANTVIGLSKLCRITEVFSRRLQIQERLTKQIAQAIEEVLKPRGVAVMIECSHLCMVMRGVEKANATTLTSCMLGCFQQENKTRDEFMSFVGVNR